MRFGYEKLIENTLFHKFKVGKDGSGIRGCRADLTKVFDATKTMLNVLTDVGKPLDGD